MSAASHLSTFHFPFSRGGDQALPFQHQAARLTWRPDSERRIALPAVIAASSLGERLLPAAVLSGVAELDALAVGFPRGALTEICGPASSGRTSVVLALMARMTQSGEACALVDATDSFDPKSASAAGVHLARLLWVRCSKTRSTVGGRQWTESSPWPVAGGQNKSQIANRKSQMDCLEQALKATDLLLQGGGFALVVVDLGDVPAQAARLVPLTSWFRFRRAVENTPTVLLVMEQEPYAKMCASVVLKLSADPQSSVASRQEQHPAHARILAGLSVTAEVVRSAAQGKKPVRAVGAGFASQAEWMKVKSGIG